MTFQELLGLGYAWSIILAIFLTPSLVIIGYRKLKRSLKARKLTSYEKISARLYKILRNSSLGEKEICWMLADLMDNAGRAFPNSHLTDPLKILDRVQSGKPVSPGEMLIVCADEIRAMVEKHYRV